MMSQPIEKVLQMRALHNLHTQLMFRDNELKLCTIGRVAADKRGDCNHSRCIHLRKEVEQIENRMAEIRKEKVEFGYVCGECGHKKKLTKWQRENLNSIKSETECPKCGSMMVPYSEGGEE